MIPHSCTRDADLSSDALPPSQPSLACPGVQNGSKTKLELNVWIRFPCRLGFTQWAFCIVLPGAAEHAICQIKGAF